MFLTFTIIQTNLVWEDKALNLQLLEDKILNIQEKTEIVVLPEMFNTGFSMNPELLAETMDGDTVCWMKRIASKKKIILTGSLMIKENGKYYNRLIWMLPTGATGFYDKRHCFAFAGEHNHFTPGKKRIIAQVKSWKINLQICYDLRFPVWARQQIKTSDTEELTPAGIIHENGHEYDILLYVANWPERRNHAWKSLLIARAIENQCYVVAVNRVGTDGNGIYHSGDSMIINPLGEILYHKEHAEDITTVSLEKELLLNVRKTFPFQADADHFNILND